MRFFYIIIPPPITYSPTYITADCPGAGALSGSSKVRVISSSPVCSAYASPCLWLYLIFASTLILPSRLAKGIRLMFFIFTVLVKSLSSSARVTVLVAASFLVTKIFPGPCADLWYSVSYPYACRGSFPLRQRSIPADIFHRARSQ